MMTTAPATRSVTVAAAAALVCLSALFLLSSSQPIDREAALAKAEAKYAAASTPEARMLARVRKVRLSCGELCDDDEDDPRESMITEPGPFFDHVRVPVDCDALFREELIDADLEQDESPREVPRELVKEFTMNGRFPVRTIGHYDQLHDTAKPTPSKSKGTGGPTTVELTWTQEEIHQLKELARMGELDVPYGKLHTNSLLKAVHNAPISGEHVLVIGGGDAPWAEAVCLAAGAKKVTRLLEHGAANIRSDHPKVDTLTHHDFRLKYLYGTLGQFDAIVTFSSLEHAGLGRYGDALLPWADIIAMARGWCVTRSGGTLTMGVPWNDHEEGLWFNAHRSYGNVRLPRLAANWFQFYDGGDVGSHRILNFRKRPPLPPSDA